MKKLSFLLTLIVSLSIIGCTEDVVGEISLPNDNTDIPADGGGGYFMFNSSHTWSAACEEEWITLSATSGKSGSNKLTYTAAPSFETSIRKAVITITNSAAAEEGKFTISQAAFEPQLTVMADSHTFTFEAEETTIDIEANFDYDVQCEADWLTIEKIERGITIATTELETMEERKAEIKIAKEKYGIEEVIEITQKPFEPTYQFRPQGNFVKNADDVTPFTIITQKLNFTFELCTDAEWITASISGAWITVSLTANTTQAPRLGNIILKGIDRPGVEVKIPIKQLSNYYIPIELSNKDFENDLQDWKINRYHNGSKTKVEVVDGKGVNGSKAIKISQAAADGTCCVAIERKLTGLEAEQMYRAMAYVRYENIPNNQGCGAVIFSPNTDQYWNASEYTYGTNNTYKKVFVDFLTDASGSATISLALGFWQGGLANGGRSTGVAYFDNVDVIKATDNELYMRESEHMKVYWDPTKLTCDDHYIDTWLSNVDKMYESYKELVNAVPQDGRQLKVLSTPGMYSGYWALAGYPILINNTPNSVALNTIIGEFTQMGTMSFGLMHEIGHVFNLGSTDWNWNDEMFANFRMQYALEMNNLGVYQQGNGDSTKKVYTGREILNMYKQDYDKTLPTGKLNDNAIHYLLARLAGDEFIGWEPFKLTFDYMRKYGTSGGNNINTNYDKFVYFVNRLSKFASEVHGKEYDLINDKNCFSDADIAAIKAQLK